VKLDRKIFFLTVVLALITGATVRAQSPPPGAEPAPPAETPDSPHPAEAPPRWMPLSHFGMTLAAGGGVTDFLGGAASSVTGTGASWDVRLAFGTRRILGVEASYVGGANTIHSLGFDTVHTRLIRNGIEGAARVNAPLYAGDTLLEPYVAVGAGWNGYRITNATSPTASASPTSTNTLSLPVALGFAVGYKGFVADARATLRPTYRQTTLSNAGGDALTNWELGAMVGFEF
jgi:hypothetical protein